MVDSTDCDQIAVSVQSDVGLQFADALRVTGCRFIQVADS